jgi:hypothetical protein
MTAERRLEHLAQESDDIVGGDHSMHNALFIYHRKHEQVVFIE